MAEPPIPSVLEDTLSRFDFAYDALQAALRDGNIDAARRHFNEAKMHCQRSARILETLRRARALP